MENEITLHVNGRDYAYSIGTKLGQIPPSETLVETLRNRMGLTGTKLSCGEGACGCCAVLMDNKAVASCMMLTVECGGKDIVTIEGLRDKETGKLDRIQEAFLEKNAFQCGYCTPGIIIAVKALLMANPHPTEKEIGEALSGNYCRCISHYQVVEAVKYAISKLEG